MIRATQIEVQRKGAYLLRGVNVSVEAGELVAILGPNGAGKSTLLRTLAGSVAPTRGQVSINGKPLARWRPQALASCRGVLSQSVHLAFPLSVRNVVELGRYPVAGRESADHRDRIVSWALRQTGMAAFGERDMLTLSGGEQQRVHLARVLAQIYAENRQEPRYLLLDEPVSSLDIAQQYRLLHLLRHLTQQLALGAVVILHDLNLAAQFADRLVMLKSGKLVDSGPPSRTLSEETLYELFDIHTHIHHPPDGAPPRITIRQEPDPSLHLPLIPHANPL